MLCEGQAAPQWGHWLGHEGQALSRHQKVRGLFHRASAMGLVEGGGCTEGQGWLGASPAGLMNWLLQGVMLGLGAGGGPLKPLKLQGLIPARTLAMRTVPALAECVEAEHHSACVVDFKMGIETREFAGWGSPGTDRWGYE